MLSSGNTASNTAAADALQVNVDAVRAGGGEALGELRTDGGQGQDLETELLDRMAALVGAAGDADDAAAPLSLAICPNTAPTAPVVAATTTVSPGSGRPMSSRPT